MSQFDITYRIMLNSEEYQFDIIGYNLEGRGGAG
jgi:hypothetical protein